MATYTIQNTYVPLRQDAHKNGDVTAADTALTAETAGYTYHSSDRPAGAFRLNPEDEQVTMIFPCLDASNNKAFEMRFFGYAAGDGPAELIADVSLTTGLARINDVTTSLYVDTITVDYEAHISAVNLADNTASDRIAKMNISTFGYAYLYAEVVDITTGMSVRPMARSF